MRTVYAAVLDIVPNPPEAPIDCFQRLLSTLTTWVESRYKRKDVIAVKLAFDGIVVLPMQDHTVRCVLEKADSCELATLEWSLPGETGSDLRWSSICHLARYEQAIQLSVAVRLFSSSVVVKPLTFALGRPRLLDDVLAAAPCFIGNQKVPKVHIDLSAPDVTSFVEDTLLSSDRPIPVIVISPDSWTDRREVDPVRLQQALLGIAQVVALQDKWAAFKLSDCIGKELSCYNGAVRLYWPGLQENADPFDHPLYLPDSIRWHAQNGQPLDRYLFRLLAAISAFRLSEAPVIRKVQETLERLNHQRIQELLAQARAGGTQIQEIETELERAWDEIYQLRRERDEVKEQVSELSAELEAQKAAWATVQQATTGSQSGICPATSEPEAPKFCNVAEVVEWARKKFADTILILDSAVDSAIESPYQHPERVAQLFEALDELVRLWKKDGKLGAPWKVALKQRGFDYSDNISMTSAGKYGSDYTFVYQNKTLLFENHVTIGAKQADSCLSVHWLRDEKKKVLVIGSCGRHGRNTLT